MKMNELESSFEIKRVIMYNAKGDKAIYHNKNVRHVSGNIYCGEITGEIHDQHCDVFMFYDGIPVGMWVSGISASDDIEVIIEAVSRHRLDTLENYKADIQSRIANDEHFKFTEVEFSKYIDPALENQMWESRKNYAIKREKIERERREKREAEDQAYIQQRNNEAQEIVDKAIAIIKGGNGTLENCNVVIYKSRYHSHTYSVINYLARKYDVKIPIKTQGWINERLARISLVNWVCNHCEFYKKKGGKCSTKVFEYVTQLAQAIKAQED